MLLTLGVVAFATEASAASSPSASGGRSSQASSVRAPSASTSSAPSASSSATGSASPRSGSASSRLWSPKRSGESDQAFFQRAGREVAQKTSTGTPGQLSPRGQAALARLARGAGYNSVRSVVTSGGVVGSSSGNSYVTYYRSGFTQANMVHRAPTGGSASTTTSSASAGASAPPPVHADPALEKSLRAHLGQTEAGRRALSQLDSAGISIRFRSGGGTSNDASSKSIILDKTMANGKDKPMSWLGVSVVHEASHAADDHRGQTPSTVSPLGARYGAAKSQMAVTNDLRKQLIAERKAYVTKQVAGEARAMTAEVRDRREHESKGTDFHRLDRTLANAYDKGHDGVYNAAGVTPPKD